MICAVTKGNCHMVTFLFAVLYAAIAACVVFYFLVFFNRPAALHRMLAGCSNRYGDRLGLSVRLLTYVWLAAVFHGLAFCIHRGAVKLLFWVADSDVRWDLALMAAMVCAGFVLGGTVGMARQFAKAEKGDLQDPNSSQASVAGILAAAFRGASLLPLRGRATATITRRADARLGPLAPTEHWTE
jgi:hypothetical protein